MKKFPHSLQHLIKLPDFAQGCDILRSQRFQREARMHAGKAYIVTTVVQEVWQRKQAGPFLQCGESITLMRERRPGPKPFILHKVASTDTRQTARYSEEAAALTALEHDFDTLADLFLVLAPILPEEEGEPA